MTTLKESIAQQVAAWPPKLPIEAVNVVDKRTNRTILTGYGPGAEAAEGQARLLMREWLFRNPRRKLPEFNFELAET